MKSIIDYGLSNLKKLLKNALPKILVDTVYTMSTKNLAGHILVFYLTLIAHNQLLTSPRYTIIYRHFLLKF